MIRATVTGKLTVVPRDQVDYVSESAEHMFRTPSSLVSGSTTLGCRVLYKAVILESNTVTGAFYSKIAFAVAHSAPTDHWLDVSMADSFINPRSESFLLRVSLLQLLSFFSFLRSRRLYGHRSKRVCQDHRGRSETFG